MQHATPKDQQSNLKSSETSTSILEEGKTTRRGRPRKMGKLKVSHAIVATGKGRGRPKKLPTSADQIGVLSNRVTVNQKLSPHRQLKSAKGVAARGRPRKKKVCSDSENSSYDEKPDYEERRPVGRPSTGAVNLNIVRTGRGQGRPKKLKHPTRKVHPHVADNQPVRKLGRPYKGGVPYEPTGKPRGRPKTNKSSPRTSCEKQQGDSLLSDVELDVEANHRTLLQDE